MIDCERRIQAALVAIDIHDMSQSDEMGTDAEATLLVVEGFLRGELPLPSDELEDAAEQKAEQAREDAMFDREDRDE